MLHKRHKVNYEFIQSTHKKKDCTLYILLQFIILVKKKLYYFHLYLFSVYPVQAESGDVTPVSGGSELEFNTNDATAGSSSTVDYDVTVTEDMEMIVTLDDEENIDPNETLTASRLSALSSIFSSNTTLTDNNQHQVCVTPKIISPMNPNVNICTNVLHSPSSSSYNLKHIENTDRIQPWSSGIGSEIGRRDLKNIIRKSNRSYEKDIPNLNINISTTGSDKWSTNKEKFLEIKNYNKTDNIDFGKNLNINIDKKVEKESDLIKPKPGAVVIRESYIEPPRISRVSKSFHDKSSSSRTPINITNIPRRASDGVTSLGKNFNAGFSQEGQGGTKIKNHSEKSSSLKRQQFVSQLSQPCGTSSKLSSHTRKSSLSEVVSIAIVKRKMYYNSVTLGVSKKKKKRKVRNAQSTFAFLIFIKAFVKRNEK